MLAAQQKKSDEEWSARLKVVEDQMHLSVQENDILQKTKDEHQRATSALRERIDEMEKVFLY